HGYSGSFNAYYDSYGEDYFFDGVRDVFENDDFTIVNLECVLSNSEARVDKTYNLKGKPEYVGIMSGSSVEACSLGNNHSRDYGEQSLTDTQNVLDEAGIVYGYNDHIGTYTTDEGMTIGVVSASLLSMSADYENYLYNGIQQLKEQGTDLIIASCHWGIEREYYPNDYQKRVAHELIDKGADLVIGNHPHVLQGVELYNGKIICYSLGNFCFGGNRNPSDKDTMMFQQTFTYVDGVLQTDVNAKIIPCMISSTSSYNDFKPTITTDDRKGLIIDNVNTYSEPYSNIRFSDSGMLTIKE
ncbi:MAG: CapA family protein, partial [Agathobacter sp.]|nr:CapA family protein [Agathobacter sp.]